MTNWFYWTSVMKYLSPKCGGAEKAIKEKKILRPFLQSSKDTKVKPRCVIRKHPHHLCLFSLWLCVCSTLVGVSSVKTQTGHKSASALRDESRKMSSVCCLCRYKLSLKASVHTAYSGTIWYKVKELDNMQRDWIRPHPLTLTLKRC